MAENESVLWVVGTPTKITRKEARKLWEEGRLTGMFNIDNEVLFEACRDFCVEGRSGSRKEEVGATRIGQLREQIRDLEGRVAELRGDLREERKTVKKLREERTEKDRIIREQKRIIREMRKAGYVWDQKKHERNIRKESVPQMVVVEEGQTARKELPAVEIDERKLHKYCGFFLSDDSEDEYDRYYGTTTPNDKLMESLLAMSFEEEDDE